MRKLRLPVFLSHRNKWVYGPICAAITVALYVSANHYPILEPRLLPFTPLDHAVPFLPWTSWIYVSDYVFAFLVFMLVRDMRNANRFLYSFFALQIVSVAIFWLWPTMYPRELFPLEMSGAGSWSAGLLTGIRKIDSPLNCCPSLHVSGCVLASFIFLDEQRSKFKWFFAWAMAIAVSTLTTKQHYAIDVFSGILLAWAMYWFFRRFFEYPIPAYSR